MDEVAESTYQTGPDGGADAMTQAEAALDDDGGFLDLGDAGVEAQ